MGNWLLTLIERKTGQRPGFVGDDESHQDYEERVRVTDVPAPPGSAPSPGATTGPGSQPAGWRPDPSGRHELRFWDGAAWSEHVSDNGASSTDPMPEPEPAGAGQ